MEIMLLSVFLAAECLVLNTLCCVLLRGDVAVVDPVCCEALCDVLLPVHRCAGGGGSTRPKLWLKPVMPMNGVIIGGAEGGWGRGGIKGQANMHLRSSIFFLNYRCKELSLCMQG